MRHSHPQQNYPHSAPFYPSPRVLIGTSKSLIIRQLFLMGNLPRMRRSTWSKHLTTQTANLRRSFDSTAQFTDSSSPAENGTRNLHHLSAPSASIRSAPIMPYID